MKILIVSQYFFPENFRINDFANGLVEKGNSVTVLCGIPNYPTGKYFKGYGLLKKKKEIYNKIKIIRVPLIPRKKGKGIELLFNYISYLISASIQVVFIAKSNFHAIFVHEPSPITVGIPAIVLKKIKKIPIYFWALDLWPESIKSAGNVNSRLIYFFALKITKFIYKHSDKILVSSEGFIQSIINKGVPKHKIIFFPQWAESIFNPKITKKLKYKTTFPDGFIVMFAGNIGEAQDFESILKSADHLRSEKSIYWIIIGSGRKENWVKQEIKNRKLEHNVWLLGRFPIEEMPELYAYSDALLVSLKKEKIFSLTIPAKIQSYLASAKPILTMLDGEGSKVVNDSKSGYAAKSGDAIILAENVRKMYQLNKNELLKLGINGRKYYERHFDRDLLLNKFLNIVKSNYERNHWKY